MKKISKNSLAQRLTLTFLLITFLPYCLGLSYLSFPAASNLLSDSQMKEITGGCTPVPGDKPPCPPTGSDDQSTCLEKPINRYSPGCGSGGPGGGSGGGLVSSPVVKGGPNYSSVVKMSASAGGYIDVRASYNSRSSYNGNYGYGWILVVPRLKSVPLCSVS